MLTTSRYFRSPIDIEATTDIVDHFSHSTVPLTRDHIDRLSAICPTDDDPQRCARASRDWWPVSMHWALLGRIPKRAAVVCQPRTTEEVSALVSLCNSESIPITPVGGRSGVCGAAIPLAGGVLVDMTAMSGVVSIDLTSKIVEVLPGTFGPELEDALAAQGLTLGHFPQSFDISTVGGWVACRSAGQFSTRYGKIEDMVCGLEVVLASGDIVRLGGAPRAAQGPDLAQLFIGSEGTFGVISRIWLRCHSAPTREERCAYVFSDFASGIDACRRILQRGATPAVLRLYDSIESARSHGGDGTSCILLVLDQGDPASVSAAMAIVHEECLSTPGCEPTDRSKVDAWMAHRNDTSALQALTRKGFVVDTMEVAAPWSTLTDIHQAVLLALQQVPHNRSASCHLSHSYAEGACLYFSFAANPPPQDVERTYIALWNSGTYAALAHGANLSHHHGIGLNRSRFVADALGPTVSALHTIKAALDPRGIFNPGKLGFAMSNLNSVSTAAAWPTPGDSDR